MKHLPWVCALVAPFATVLVVLALLYVSDPLHQLEREASRQLAYTAAVETSTDDQFYWSALRVQAILEQNLGATVTYGVPTVLGAAGMTNPHTREVVIDEKAHWTTRFETLTHEAGHLLQPGFPTRMDNEVFAEAVSYVVAIHDGDRDALRRSARYLSGAKASLHLLRDYRREILRAASFLE